ncbi:uncharacterized protein LOC106644765 isoform X1 [Copidosoma floridanum]|uniref:uncharacterized protein LOC106644765 isoform X1 n=1 Tax=Copidosoma floridanum TaxID=29053 RepID=UPI0006C9D67F|nr:uncharacterized protein LOC106644765 isoform X1 [Copidosoma floridanum]
MAFMMPVVKNEWDIYKTNRSRRSSECSNPQACRSRKKNAVLMPDCMIKRLGMLKVRGPVAVDLPRLGLPDVTGSSFGATEQPSLFAQLLARLPELAPVADQKYRILAPKDRKLQFPKQVPQPARRQAEAVIKTGRGQYRRPAQPVVKQSRGFGPTAAVRLETDRHKTHLGTPDAPDATQRQSRHICCCYGLLIAHREQPPLSQSRPPPPPEPPQ